MFYIVQFARNLYRLSECTRTEAAVGKKTWIGGSVPPFAWTDCITRVSPSGK